VGRFFFGPDRIVTRVTEGGPGEAAGIQVGDRVVSVDGIPAEELPMQSRWPQKRVGESRTLTLERDGLTVSAEVVYGPQTRDPARAGVENLILNLAFLGFGLWALFTVRTSLAWLVALIGVSWAVASASGPHLGSWQGVAEHVRITSALLCTILILRFLVTFPKPKKVSGSRAANGLIKGAFYLYIALLVLELAIHPVLYSVYPIVLMLLMLLLMVLCLVAVGHSAVKCTAAERRETGLGLVLAGLALGVLLPLIAPALAGALSLGTDLVRDWVWVLVIAFPASLALAVRRRARLGDVAVA
jgi:hypothetical protein